LKYIIVFVLSLIFSFPVNARGKVIKIKTNPTNLAKLGLNAEIEFPVGRWFAIGSTFYNTGLNPFDAGGEVKGIGLNGYYYFSGNSKNSMYISPFIHNYELDDTVIVNATVIGSSIGFQMGARRSVYMGVEVGFSYGLEAEVYSGFKPSLSIGYGL